MATTYEEIIGYLKEDGLSFDDRRDSDEGLVLFFSKSEMDDKPEVVSIKLDEDGEFIHFYEPQRYTFLPGLSNEKVFELLLIIQNETKMLQWEYDPADGEIRACVELPLEDALLTKRLFMRVLNGLVKMMDVSHERILSMLEQ
ncbi:MAG: hypothetical protein Q9M31_08780 [Mariprofundus sp.]|nr:hypothetical protein [Mariprofundus sp.]